MLQKSHIEMVVKYIPKLLVFIEILCHDFLGQVNTVLKKHSLSYDILRQDLLFVVFMSYNAFIYVETGAKSSNFIVE